MPTTPKQFGFIRTTLALWAANVGSFIRAGVVSDSPNGGNAWGVNVPGFGWLYAAMRGAHESFASVAATGTGSFGAGVTVTGGKTTVAPGAADYASFNIPTLSAYPTSPVSGDVFADGGSQYLYGKNHRVIKGASDVIGTGSGLGMLDAVNITKAWQIQLGVSNDLAFWNYSGSWSRKVQFSSVGGIGFFGVTAPTTRPTVNAAATDLATAIALTNQLRTHLIACGLVQ